MNRPRRRPEYVNVPVFDHGQEYRVPFHRGGHCMGIWRKRRGGESAVDPDGPTGRRVVALARPMFEEMMASEPPSYADLMNEQRALDRERARRAKADLLAEARAIASAPASTTYPSMSSAQGVRDVITRLIAALE